MAVTRPVDTPVRRELQKLADAKKSTGVEFSPTGDTQPFTEEPLPLHGGGFRPRPGLEYQDKALEARNVLIQDQAAAESASAGELGEVFRSTADSILPDGRMEKPFSKGYRQSAQFIGGSPEEKEALRTGIESSVAVIEELDPNEMTKEGGLYDKYWPNWRQGDDENPDPQEDLIEKRLVFAQGLERFLYNPELAKEAKNIADKLQYDRRLAMAGTDIKNDDSFMNSIAGGIVARARNEAGVGTPSAKATVALTGVIALDIADDILNQMGAIAGAYSAEVTAADALGAGDVAQRTREVVSQTPLG